MMKMIRLVMVFGIVCGLTAAGNGAEKKAAAKKSAAKGKTAAAARAVMNDDIYIEIKAHEAAFLAAAMKNKGDLKLGTEQEKMEAVQYAQKKQDEFNVIRGKLLAKYKVSEQAYKDYQAKLTSEGWGEVKTQFKNIDWKSPKLDDKNAFNDRARKIADGISMRTGEIEAQQLYR